MKKILTLFLITQVLVSCEQVLLVPVAPEPVEPPPPCGTSPSAGSASFTKFVAFGSAYVSGFQAGALYNDGQANSLARILAKQFECVGGPTTFNQPDINSVNGYNLQLSIPGVITLGRLVLFDPDGTSGTRTATPQPSAFPGSSVTCPSPVTTPALPAPYNTADLPSAFTGNKAALNNFGVPLIYLGQALIPDTGNPASPYYNPLYARFASSPGVSTLLGDALTAGGSFYLIWLGVEDALLYAALGASSTYPLTSEAAFTGQYTTAITTMLGANPTFKGVVGNIPSITTLPYFFTVPWNTITLDAATASSLTTNLANSYNAIVNAARSAGVIPTDAERDSRILSYVPGKNGVLMTDEGLTDLTAFMTGAGASALIPYAKARQAIATDLVPLGAGAILGTCYGGSPTAVFGVSFPVEDKYMLSSAEIVEIETRIAAFNATISTVVAGSSNRLALADVKTAYQDLVTAKVMVFNGVTISPSFAPPTGAFSLDGLLPNNRGNAFTANVFIDAINAKFGASVPKASLADYSGTGLPVNPL
jgi:hypothetical protein